MVNNKKRRIQIMSDEEWMNMKDVASQLQISYWKLQRLVDRGTIPSKDDPLDRRARLVNINEVKQIFKIKN
jgi:predicted site-specific integrase-resolvase